MIRFEPIPARVLAPFFALAIAGCAGAPPAPTPAAKAELAPTGTLRVAVFTGNPVLGTRSRNTGHVTGTTATLGRALGSSPSIRRGATSWTSRLRTSSSISRFSSHRTQRSAASPKPTGPA